ncbi:hypothetical protein SteCoe_1911 [Stentor coeruleus]|uniref:Uncharacterized protein n=1 Tax=Stentor coeruleus TaxID=5963 RepID=A0A1R2D0V4_9CILI|nr:hypothetical protein SteCoe_1911 [Stentor coeruleus]
MTSEESKVITIDKILIRKLLKKLTSLFYDDMKVLCEVAGYHITDLIPKPKESFAEKGLTSDVENIRFIHYEENRIAKLLKIASDFASNPDGNLHRSPSTINIMKQLNINVVPHNRNSRTNSVNFGETYKSFHKPQDIIQYNYEREKEKYNKSLQMIEKISSIKEEANRKAQEKLKRIADREKKLLADKMKKEEEHEKHTQLQIEKRRNILQKKYEIEESIDNQCCDIGILLEKRMNQLSEREKKILREKMMKKESKIRTRINNEFQKLVVDDIKVKEEGKEVEVMISELQNKIESRIRQYEGNISKRIQHARNHSEKVEQRFSQNLKDEFQKQEEKLKKIIDKTKKCEEKKDKKTYKSKENAEKLKSDIERSFDRRNRGIKDLYEAELLRIELIKQREKDKTKTFNNIKSQINEVHMEKKYRNTTREIHHSSKYSQTQEDYLRYKERVMEKHQRLQQVAEEIKIHKDLLSNIKRRNNYEVQNARSFRSSPLKVKSSSVHDPRERDISPNHMD